MSSSMLAGERKWGTARRGGMTVLGKVAVPKPLNLPSQKLENHGLDPNVEIVPKGTLSWGSRTSASNPWISSSPPNADSVTGSPTHLSGRPSSAGTRPSSSGSDKTHEAVATAWISSSKPTSSSGTLSSNHTLSSSLRPKSADNRPTSSHLSRFAEPVPKSSSAWGPSTTAERLGVKSSKEDGFSLSSGDFPNLGSEKDNLTKIIESEDQFPSSTASGRITQAQEDNTLQTDVKDETVNIWKADDTPSAEDDRPRGLDKRQQDAQHYINTNSSPQPFDAWRGPPMNGPPSVWYGGRPHGPAFGAPYNNPRGFPMEAYPYYHPQFEPPPLAGSRPVPPGAGSRGPPQSGDLCRAQMPDTYARPNMPFRPGFYPGPPGPINFEGYCRPPMGYYNNERDIPYMGMAAPRPFYNGYPTPATDSGNTHGRSAAHVPAVKSLSEQLEPDYSGHNQAPRRVRLKNDNECNQREADENQTRNSQFKVLNPGESRHPLIFSRNNEWGAEEDTEVATFAKRTTTDDNSSHGHRYAGNSADSGKLKMLEGLPNVKLNRSERIPSVSTDMPQLPPASDKDLPFSAGVKDSELPPASDKDLPFSAGVKDSALIRKINGLNAKFRTSDGRYDAHGASNQEEEGNGLPLANTKSNTYNVEPCHTTEPAERNQFSRDTVSATHGAKALVGHMPTKPRAVLSRRSHHGGQGRTDQRDDEKIINIPGADGCQRKHFITDSSSAVTAKKIESVPVIYAHGSVVTGEFGWNTVMNPAGNVEGDSVETDDSTDIQSQRAKMRELAKQRAMQLQKEEEERTREQKAKALAKLEELNRRALASDSACQKVETKQATCFTDTEPIADAKFPEPGVDPSPNCDVTTVDRTFNENQADQPVELLRNWPLEVQQSGSAEPVVSPLVILDDDHDGRPKQGASQFSDGGTSRYQRKRYNQMDIIPSQKGLNEKPVPVISDTEKDNNYVATAHVSSQEVTSSESKLIESCISKMSNAAVVTSTHQRRKSNRNSKNKHKLDEPPQAKALPDASPSDTGKESVENVGCKNSFPNLGNPVTEPDKGVQPHEAGASLLSEETNWNASNHWKPQPSHRMLRSQPTNRFVDKLHGSDNVIWAPVRTQNKAKDTVEASQKSVEDSDISIKGDTVAHNAPKGKRAEMERYVPKPVALELAQQGSMPPLSSISSSRSNEGLRKEQSGPASSPSPPPIISASVYVGSGVDNEGDSRATKHKKDQGTWRQRSSVETSHPKVSTYDPSMDFQQSKEPLQLVKNDMNPSSSEIKSSSAVTSADHYNIPSNTAATLSKNASFKHQSAVNRGKRHLARGVKSTGNHFDSESTRNEIDENNSHSFVPTDSNQTDRATSSKENRSLGERMSSHWQPKSHTISANDQHGNRSIGGESFTTEVNKQHPRKDHKQLKVQAEPQHVKESNSVSQPLPSQSVNVKKDVAESIVCPVQEFDQEKGPTSAKGPPSSSRQNPVDPIESAPVSRDDQLERNIQSGSRRNARQNSHSFRSHQPRAEWSSGHDNRPHSANTVRERQKQNAHYEYQPVGPFKGNKTEKVEEPIDGPDKIEQKHWDRGHNHTKRGGNYYRRPNGPIHVDSGHSN